MTSVRVQGAPTDLSEFIPGESVSGLDVAAQNGSVASELEGVLGQLQSRRKRIALPPDDVWDELPRRPILIAKPIELKTNMGVVQLLDRTTVKLQWFWPATNKTEDIEGGWYGLATELGAPTAGKSVGDLITLVCGSPEVVAGVAEVIVAFITGRRSQIEQALGE